MCIRYYDTEKKPADTGTTGLVVDLWWIFFSFSFSRLVQQKRIATRNKNCLIRCCEIKKKYNQNVHKPIWRCIESEMKDKFHSFMQFNCTVFCTNIIYTVKKPNREMWISVMQRTVWKLSSFCHHQTDHIALNISFKLTITMAWIAARKWRTKIEKKINKTITLKLHGR